MGLLKTTTLGPDESSRASSTFWMLPPESVPARVATLGVRTSNSATSWRASASISGALDPPALPERPLADALEHEIETDAERADDALAEAVVGHVAQAELLPRAHVELADRRAEEPHVARRRAALSRDDLGELALAVAVHAGDAEDLALAEHERDVLDPRRDAVAAGGDAGELEQDVPGGMGRAPALGGALSSSATGASRARFLAEHDAHDLGLELGRGARAEVVLRQRADDAALP